MNHNIVTCFEEESLLMENQTSYLDFPGATTIGIICSEGVILASEKRIVYGNLVFSRNVKKIFKISENIGVASAGLVSDMQILIREVKAYTNLYKLEVGRTISVKSAAKMISNILFSHRLFPLITQTIVGGFDSEGPKLFSLDIIGSNIPDKFIAVGSGSEIALGVLEVNYNEGMGAKEGKDLVIKALKAAISRDTKSGDGIDLLIITKSGVREETIKF